MNYEKKYLKYKEKYIQLKKQYGGEITNYELKVENEHDIINISYNSEPVNATNLYYNIKNFKINITPATGGELKEINLPYNSFIVNQSYFNSKLDITEAKKQTKITFYSILQATKYDFTNCELSEVPDQYLKIGYHVASKANTVGTPDEFLPVKKYIESYYRKNICIYLENSELYESRLSLYHNIIKLITSLFIVNSYNKIEYYKYIQLKTAGANIVEINNKYFKIYQNIPKYIESNILNDKLQILSNGRVINNKGLNILFDTGNQSVSLISRKFRNELNIDRHGSIDYPLYEGRVVFRNFIKPAISGIGNNPLEITNLYCIKIKFIDPKLINDKEYTLYCFEANLGTTTDLLISQVAMSELYDDGYSIKWYKHDGDDGKARKGIQTGFYNNLLERVTIINQIDFTKINQQNYIDLYNYTIKFLSGTNFEIGNVDNTLINNVYPILKEIYTKIRVQRATQLYQDYFLSIANKYNFNKWEQGEDFIINRVFKISP